MQIKPLRATRKWRIEFFYLLGALAWISFCRTNPRFFFADKLFHASGDHAFSHISKYPQLRHCSQAMGPMGLEPITLGLKGLCSTIELRTQGSRAFE